MVFISSGLKPSKYTNFYFKSFLKMCLIFKNIGEYIAVMAYLCQTIVLALCYLHTNNGSDLVKAYFLRCIITSLIGLILSY